VSKIGEKGRKEMWAEEKKRKWKAAVCGYREQRREKEEKRRKREGCAGKKPEEKRNKIRKWKKDESGEGLTCVVENGENRIMLSYPAQSYTNTWQGVIFFYF
jgi:hypothetical protein